jgi:hypothetical protein
MYNFVLEKFKMFPERNMFLLPLFVAMRLQQLTCRHTQHNSMVAKFYIHCEFSVRHYFEIHFKKALLISAGRQNDVSNVRCFLSLRNMRTNPFHLVEQAPALLRFAW